jgi:hypothetical protein
MTFDADPVIRRLQTGAVVWCAGATALSLAGWPSRLDVAAGIMAGGVLTAVSFYAIKSSIDAILGLIPLAPTAPPPPGTGSDDTSPTPGPVPGVVSQAPQDRAAGRRAAVGALAKMAGRYALLAVLAYVMIARLRLHPIGLVVGASSLVASAALEAGRWVARPSRARPS